MNTKLIGVQYLRAIAAIFVVVGHISGMAGSNEYFGIIPNQIQKYGWIGVDIFFVISGFIISIVSLSESSVNPKIDIKTFFTNRFIRIVPFMWLIIILYGAIYIYVTNGDPIPTIRAFFLWPIGELRPNVIWTLRHEMLFYILFALSFLSFKNKMTRLILLFWSISPLIVSLICSLLSIPLPNKHGNEWEQILIFIANPVNIEFGCGVLLGLWHLKYNKAKKNPSSIAIIIVFIGAIAQFIAAFTFDLKSGNLDGAIYLSFMSSGLLWLSILFEYKRSNISKFIEFIGDASYSIYLTHGLTLLLVLTIVKHISPNCNIYAVHFICLASSISAGAIAHIFIEKPIVRLGRKLISR